LKWFYRFLTSSSGSEISKITRRRFHSMSQPPRLVEKKEKEFLTTLLIESGVKTVGVSVEGRGADRVKRKLRVADRKQSGAKAKEKLPTIRTPCARRNEKRCDRFRNDDHARRQYFH